MTMRGSTGPANVLRLHRRLRNAQFADPRARVLLESGVFGNLAPGQPGVGRGHRSGGTHAARRAALGSTGPSATTRWFNAERLGRLEARRARAYPLAPGARPLATAGPTTTTCRQRPAAMRARLRGVEAVLTAPLTSPELRAGPRRTLAACLQRPGSCRRQWLFVFPAQSNFSGVVHPLELMHRGAGSRLGRAARCGRRTHRRGSARPRAMRGNGVRQPCRVYKRCSATRTAWTTARRGETPSPRRSGRGSRGGTVNFATAQGPRAPAVAREAGFEDGTPELPVDPRRGDQATATWTRSASTIGRRGSACLTGWLLLRELDGADVTPTDGPVVPIYGPGTTTMRGGTVTLERLLA